ncbi:hypothetical protein K503DRAFT_549054 [Rhizopogon vinicolor AM-OR11-026]|uniref:Uncharacterized protein n=1 Tax=Rhizopogon vinicolor AM-OR11-026 TaxID=1314800 RepID=A0A1B7MKQ3_9AGAM|nr:hypothetical protein K503DRAFT_549054 [Rhizopogon vinicolor AM-OR11-026]
MIRIKIGPTGYFEMHDYMLTQMSGAMFVSALTWLALVRVAFDVLVKPSIATAPLRLVITNPFHYATFLLYACAPEARLPSFIQ